VVGLSGRNLHIEKVNGNLSKEGLNLVQLGGKDVEQQESKFLNVVLTESNLYGESTRTDASIISVLNSNYAQIKSVNAALRVMSIGDESAGTIVIQGVPNQCEIN